MKSTLGKVSGIMIALALITSAAFVASLVRASDYSQTFTEPISISDSGLSLGQSVAGVFNIIVSEALSISGNFKGPGSLPSTPNGTLPVPNETFNETSNETSLECGADSVELNQITTLWMDYRSGGSEILNATAEFNVSDGRLVANYNNASARYEYLYNFTGAANVGCNAYSDSFASASSEFMLSLNNTFVVKGAVTDSEGNPSGVISIASGNETLPVNETGDRPRAGQLQCKHRVWRFERRPRWAQCLG